MAPPKRFHSSLPVPRFPPGLNPPPSGINPAPVVQSVTPATDRVAGGASVTVRGLYFVTGASVTFGGVAATGVVFVDSSTITCTTPAHAAGAVDVVVTNPNGSAGTLPAGFTYIASVLVSISPPSGTSLGGDPVTITGTGLIAGSTITIGGVPATAVVYVNDTTYTCVTPAGTAGTVVDVVLTEALGATATLPASFVYVTFVIPTGAPAPLLDLPTSPNTVAPTGSYSETQAGIRWAPSVSIHAAPGNYPNTCTFTIDGRATPPTVNVDVSFVFNGRLKFAGTILNIESTYEDSTRNFVYAVTAVDYTWQLNRYRPQGRYAAKFPSEIIRDLVQKFAPGYSVAYIDPAIDLHGKISLRLDGQSDFSTVLTEVCRNAGDTHWKVDYYKNLRVWEGTDATLPAVTSLVDGLASPKLWNDPPVKLSIDLSQIRNKVTITGKGTSVVKNPLKLTNIQGTSGYDGTLPNYDYTGIVIAAIPVASIEGFASPPLTGGGGYALVDGLPIKYSYASTFLSSGASFVNDPGQPDNGTPNLVVDFSDSVTVANAAKLAVNIPYDAGPTSYGFTYRAWPEGASVLPMTVQQDNSSIALYGVHEYSVNDSHLTDSNAMVARALAELKKFAFPIKKLEYTSDDENSAPGARMRADLSSPLVHDDFVLQEVTLVHDEFGFRYEIVADTAARYEFNDLLLDLDTPSIVPSPAGLVTQATRQTQNVVLPTNTNQIYSASRYFRIANARGGGALDGLGNINAVPVTLASGIAGKVLAPLYAHYRSRSGPFPTGSNPGFSIRHKNIATDLTSSVGVLGTTGANGDKSIISPLQTGGQWTGNTSLAPAQVGADLVLFGTSGVNASGESDGVIDEVWATVYYTILTVPGL